MAHAGDTYDITLKRSHLEWGSYRYTNSRDIIYGEGYIPIPADIAYSFELYNKNGTNEKDILGKNIFNCRSIDGYYNGKLRAQGTQDNPIYAKQFSGDKDLKSIGSWFNFIQASEGDTIRITWTSPFDILIEKL
jgi:hypothetical protein